MIIKNKKIYYTLNFCIAFIWIANGLLCKIMDLVPRHQKIVESILATPYAFEITKVIGVAEVIMAIWIVSGYKGGLNAYTQILVIGTMNILEFILVPDLLLWGRFNSVFASILVLVIYLNEFYIKPHNTSIA